MSESSCVNVCLVAMDGRAAMHRISPFFDPQCDSLDMDKTCRVCVYLCVCVMCVCVIVRMWVVDCGVCCMVLFGRQGRHMLYMTYNACG